MNKAYTTLIAYIITCILPVVAWGFEAMTDEQLLAVTAGNANSGYDSQEALSRIPFRYSSEKATVDGEIIVLPLSTYNQTATLQLMGNAQSNLNSLININAVNSPVNILLNLNVNVNSTIESLNQLNKLSFK